MGPQSAPASEKRDLHYRFGPIVATVKEAAKEGDQSATGVRAGRRLKDIR